MLSDRTVRFADEVLDLIDDFVPGVKIRIIAEQLVRSATSTAANYRAAQRARSRAEFSSKMCIVLEEADESKFWLERIEQKAFVSPARTRSSCHSLCQRDYCHDLFFAPDCSNRSHLVQPHEEPTLAQHRIDVCWRSLTFAGVR
jgi:four helix bundle protein